MLSLDETITGIRTHLNRQECDGCPLDGPKRGWCIGKLLESAGYWLKEYKNEMKRQEDDLR